MPSEAPVLPAQTEKPQHYAYLKEFRTQQCPLFLQHKCTQHRPFTCFNWHFMNQRRRRPIRRRDGSFNYSPDNYCTKYDEATGHCQDGEDCPFLHRTAGDTERRYHLRYYKTGTCIYETDSKGHCVKNGPHCAFAHGAHDLRPPVYDIRELQQMETTEKSLHTVTPSSLEKDRALTEDPRWNDTSYVLANYKTEQCKRPPRLCRQGYACPQFHNSRDRRRSPKKFRYRSTPCPNVKHGDDWGDPAQCESGDNCAYCHTRTEQQFHPEIYKSTKCNDMVQTSFCPRGPFCAFAHVEQEMTVQREMNVSTENSLAAFVTNALPQSSNNIGMSDGEGMLLQNQKEDTNSVSGSHSPKLPDPIGKERCNSISYSLNNIGNTNHSASPLPEPIGKGRTSSTSSSINSDCGSLGHYQRVPGPTREDGQTKLRQQLEAIENDVTIDVNEKATRKQNLLLLHNLNESLSSSVSPLNNPPMSNMSPHAPSFYPPGETVESVVGSALDDLSLEDFDISSIDKELDRDNDSNSVSSSLSTGLSAPGCFGATSVPVSIPPRGIQRGSIGSLSQSPTSPFGSFSTTPASLISQLPMTQQPKTAVTEPLDQVLVLSLLSVLLSVSIFTLFLSLFTLFLSLFTLFLSLFTLFLSLFTLFLSLFTLFLSLFTLFLSLFTLFLSLFTLFLSLFTLFLSLFTLQPNPGMFAVPAYTELNSMSPQSGGPHSPLYSTSYTNSQPQENQRLREELNTLKSNLSHWEEAYSQAKSACEAWKKEGEESVRKVKLAEDEKLQTTKQRDEALNRVKTLQQELDQLRNASSISGYIHCLQRSKDLDYLPLQQLQQIQQQLRLDKKHVDELLFHYNSRKCIVCKERNRTFSFLFFSHTLLFLFFFFASPHPAAFPRPTPSYHFTIFSLLTCSLLSIPLFDSLPLYISLYSYVTSFPLLLAFSPTNSSFSTLNSLLLCFFYFLFTLHFLHFLFLRSFSLHCILFVHFLVLSLYLHSLLTYTFFSHSFSLVSF
ncbi:UNKL [Acanthosepion pharaonis]|uniref:UNKL n=1 Tax=Acanthosepion pharaonis TaxID=158019 RepID=A0A812D9W8_ACAPH|nr:UNKL [Sepia pharaonis]